MGRIAMCATRSIWDWVHTLALALLMPVSGAVFTMGLVALLQLRLILGEEDFLRARLGEAYAAYCARVPRLLPALRPRVAASGRGRDGGRRRWQRYLCGG